MKVTKDGRLLKIATALLFLDRSRFGKRRAPANLLFPNRSFANKQSTRETGVFCLWPIGGGSRRPRETTEKCESGDATAVGFRKVNGTI